MEVKGTSPSLPKSRQLKRACQYGRWNVLWMWNYSWRGRLDGKWIAPHHLVIRCEMFEHVLEQGQKEAECMICWGYQHSLPKLDPKADISAIQLVGPHTSREEFKSLYYEVYKLQRLLGSPQRARTCGRSGVLPRRLPGAGGGEMPKTKGEPNPTDVWPPSSRAPRRGRRDASMERRFTEVREAHQKALTMVAALEEDIEQLSCPLTRSWLEAWAHSRSQDCHRWRSRGQKRRHCQVQPEDCCAPYFKYHPSQRGSESEGNKEAPEDLNLEDPSGVGARGWLPPLGAGQKLRRGEYEDALSQTSNRRVGEVGDLESLDIWNTQLVAGASYGSWSGWPQKIGMWGMGLFLTPAKGEWTTLGREWSPGPNGTAVSSPKEFPAAAQL